MRGSDEIWKWGRWLLYIGTLGAVAAVVSGFVSADDRVGIRRDITGLMALATVIMTMGADRGANLVYRFGVAVKNESPQEAGHGHGEADSATLAPSNARISPSAPSSTTRLVPPRPTSAPKPHNSKKHPHEWRVYGGLPILRWVRYSTPSRPRR